MQKGKVWRWKQGQATKKEHRNVDQACSNRIRKLNAQLELELMRLVKGEQIISTGMSVTKEDGGLLLTVAGDERHVTKLTYSVCCWRPLLARSAFRPLCIVAEFGGEVVPALGKLKITKIAWH